MTKQSLIRLDDFITFVQDNLFKETYFILSSMLKYLLNYLASYEAGSDILALTTLIFNRIYQELQTVDTTDTERVQILSTWLINYAVSDDQVIQLKNWL